MSCIVWISELLISNFCIIFYHYLNIHSAFYCRAPWINNVWFFGTSYIIPNVDSIVVGGTAQKGDFNTIVDLNDSSKILNDVYKIFPSLQDANLVNFTTNFEVCNNIDPFIYDILLFTILSLMFIILNILI